MTQDVQLLVRNLSVSSKVVPRNGGQQMTHLEFSKDVPVSALRQIVKCRFDEEAKIGDLEFRNSPYWHTLLQCRHIGIHRPDERICNWNARLLTADKRYVQRCLGPALDTGRGKPLSFTDAVELAFAWFASPECKNIGNVSKEVGKTSRVCFSPIGNVYTVGHALRDYSEWTAISRSPGGHYNNLVLINYHLAPNFAQIPLESFKAEDLARLARQVLETAPRFGFMARQSSVAVGNLTPDELRRRKRTFNSLVSILRMAFRHAWENGKIESERPWRCLRRIAVNHSPRTIFLDRVECRRLLEACTPALRKLVLAALYTGCRVGELGALKVEDVGHQVFGVRIAAFKRSPARFVFLPDEGMAFFLKCCEGKDPRDHVLKSDMGKVWRRQHTSLFRRAVALANLPSDFVFHGLRHTYASDLIKSGISMDIVAKQLGHSNTITVSNTYGHLAEHFREKQIRTRFSELDLEHSREAKRRHSQLENMWQRFQTVDSRSYGALSVESSEPKKSYANTHKSVLEVFRSAD